MSTNHLFGIPYYHASVKQHTQIKEKFLPYFDNDEYFDLPSTWLAPCKTSIHSQKAHDEIPFNDFLQLVVREHFIPYMLDLKPFDKDSLSVEPLHAWGNKYAYNEGQESHNHIDGATQFSCNYVLEQPENSCEFLFVDRNDYFSSMGLGQLFNFTSPIKNHQIDMQEGDIVIFPAFVDHAVSRNRSHEERKTISANFRLNVRKSNKYSVNYGN